jgi:hypothetical protein
LSFVRVSINPPVYPASGKNKKLFKKEVKNKLKRLESQELCNHITTLSFYYFSLRGLSKPVNLQKEYENEDLVQKIK